MTWIERLEIQRKLDQIVSEVLLKARKNCVNCTKFEIEKEICSICSLRPPAYILVKGCENFLDKDDDDIPF